MITTNIFKAQPTIENEPILSHVISITDTMPEVVSLDDARAVYAKEGTAIADALFSCLPGGTLDALLIEMLDRKRSLFVINPYNEKPGETQ